MKNENLKNIRLQLEVRSQITINNDPQRRCYDGVNASEKKIWTDWEWLELSVKKEKVEERLKFWRELNKYSLSEGGTTKKEFRIVEIKSD